MMWKLQGNMSPVIVHKLHFCRISDSSVIRNPHIYWLITNESSSTDYSTVPNLPLVNGNNSQCTVTSNKKKKRIDGTMIIFWILLAIYLQNYDFFPLKYKCMWIRTRNLCLSMKSIFTNFYIGKASIQGHLKNSPFCIWKTL